MKTLIAILIILIALLPVVVMGQYYDGGGTVIPAAASKGMSCNTVTITESGTFTIDTLSILGQNETERKQTYLYEKGSTPRLTLEYYPPDYAAGSPIIISNPDSIQWYNNIDQFVYMWNDYEMVCYNDSTFLEHQHFMPEGENLCLVGWECLIERHYKDYWWHRKSTPKGFIEYLKSKQK